ncbi:hypothetical protein [Thalassobacillus cyri]|nr:hypothetical protein [Thalassobacillus cyri]
MEVGIPDNPLKLKDVEAEAQMYNLSPLSIDELEKRKPVYHFSKEKRVLFWPLKIIN